MLDIKAIDLVSKYIRMAVLHLGLQLVINYDCPITHAHLGEPICKKDPFPECRISPNNNKYKSTNAWRNLIPWVIKEKQIKVIYHIFIYESAKYFFNSNTVLVEHVETDSLSPRGNINWSQLFGTFWRCLFKM